MDLYQTLLDTSLLPWVQIISPTDEHVIGQNSFCTEWTICMVLEKLLSALFRLSLVLLFSYLLPPWATGMQWKRSMDVSKRKQVGSGSCRHYSAKGYWDTWDLWWSGRNLHASHSPGNAGFSFSDEVKPSLSFASWRQDDISKTHR